MEHSKEDPANISTKWSTRSLSPANDNDSTDDGRKRTLLQPHSPMSELTVPSTTNDDEEDEALKVEPDLDGGMDDGGASTRDGLDGGSSAENLIVEKPGEIEGNTTPSHDHSRTVEGNISTGVSAKLNDEIPNGNSPPPALPTNSGENISKGSTIRLVKPEEEEESWAGAPERNLASGSLPQSFTFPLEKPSCDPEQQEQKKIPEAISRIHIGEIGRRVTEPVHSSSASSTPPLPGTPTLQERRLTLRKLRMDATPVVSSFSSTFADTDAEGSVISPTAAEMLGAKSHKIRGHFRRSSTLPRTFSEGTPSRVSLFQSSNNGENVHTPPSNSKVSILNLQNAPLSPIQASLLMHHRSNSMENSKYIEHLEREVADLNTKLKSYTDASSEQSHAAVVQRLNNKVRNLQNQVTEWETVFEERVREMERQRSMEKNTSHNQLRSMRERVSELEKLNEDLEEQLEMEKRRSVAISMDASEKQAIIQQNDWLLNELTFAHERIKDMEDRAERRRPRKSSISTIRVSKHRQQQEEAQSHAESSEVIVEDITEEQRPLSRTTTPVLPDSPESTTSNSATSAGIRTRKMRKFPSGISAPKQLILPSSVEHSPSTRQSSMDFTHSRRSSGMWSFSRELNERDSLFAELSKAGIPETPQVTDDESASVTSTIPLSALRPAPVQIIDNPSTEENAPPSPTDTETSAEESIPSRSPSPPSPGQGSSILFPMLFAPLKLTGSVISTIGRSVYDPRWAVREVRNRTMESLSENPGSEEIDDMDIAFGGSPDCTPKGYNVVDVVNGQRSRPGSSSRRTPEEQVSPLIGRGNKSLYYEGSPDMDSDEKEMHLNSTLHKLCYQQSPSPLDVLNDPRRGIFAARDLDATPTKSNRHSMRFDPRGSGPTKILPIRPSPESERRRGKRRSSPPPYTQADPFKGNDNNPKASHAQELARRYSVNFSEEEAVAGEEWRNSLIIPESELARVLRQDLSNGSLLRVMGLEANSPLVLWTKLFFTFLVAIFVGVRDGPEAALESVHMYQYHREKFLINRAGYAYDGDDEYNACEYNTREGSTGYQ